MKTNYQKVYDDAYEEGYQSARDKGYSKEYSNLYALDWATTIKKYSQLTDAMVDHGYSANDIARFMTDKSYRIEMMRKFSIEYP